MRHVTCDTRRRRADANGRDTLCGCGEVPVFVCVWLWTPRCALDVVPASCGPLPATLCLCGCRGATHGAVTPGARHVRTTCDLRAHGTAAAAGSAGARCVRGPMRVRFERAVPPLAVLHVCERARVYTSLVIHEWQCTVRGSVLCTGVCLAETYRFRASHTHAVQY